MNKLLAGQKNIYVRERLKRWFVFLMIFIPAYVSICYWYYLFMVNREMEILTANLTRHVGGIMATIDAEKFEMLYEQETVENENCPPKPRTLFEDPKNGYFPDDNPLFREHMEWIKSIVTLEPEWSVYTYVIGPEKDYVITIGSSWYFTNHDQSFKFCQLYKAPNMYKGLSERVDLWIPYHDEYGEWITTHMPIKDKNGKFVGAVSVDIPASQIVDMRRHLLLSMAIILLATILISLGFAYNLIVIISKPLSKLTVLTSRLRGIKTIADFSGFNMQKGRWRDETDILSEAIQDMISRLDKQTRELAQSRAAMQELAHGVIRAQENERKYISRELHGEAGQLLAILKTSLGDILLDLPADDDVELTGNFDLPVLRKRLIYAVKQIEETLGVVRTISHQMRPSLLDVGDINLALKDYCSEFSQRQKIEVVYEGSIFPNPPEEVAVSFYRFLQEALTNVSKHSSATRVWVHAEIDADWIQMSVEDNGHENPSVPAAKGIGIAGLKERFFLLGGNVEGRAIPGGFLIVALAPLNRK